jgi:predicted nucleic acid-binding protein
VSQFLFLDSGPLGLITHPQRSAEVIAATDNVTPGRYVPLSDEALRLAAELWARSRQEGQPTADSKALDIDVILAAQALSFGVPPAEVVVATTKPRHFAQFITAKAWPEIL